MNVTPTLKRWVQGNCCLLFNACIHPHAIIYAVLQHFIISFQTLSLITGFPFAPLVEESGIYNQLY
jgi:hypothetical protein